MFVYYQDLDYSFVVFVKQYRACQAVFYRGVNSTIHCLEELSSGIHPLPLQWVI